MLTALCNRGKHSEKGHVPFTRQRLVCRGAQKRQRKGRWHSESADKFSSGSDRDSAPIQPHRPDAKRWGKPAHTRAGRARSARPSGPGYLAGGTPLVYRQRLRPISAGPGPRRHRLLQMLAAPPGSAQQVRPERWPGLVTWPRPATQGAEGQPRAGLPAPPPTQGPRPSVSPGLSGPRTRYSDPTRPGGRAD